jgi:hypothetical protein
LADPRDTRDGPDNSAPRTDRLISLIQTSGGALTVALAITLTFVVALVAIPLAADGDRVTIATAAFTGIGTIAGAYFGVRVGADGKERAEQDRQEAQLVVERVAAKVDDAPVREAREEVRQEQRGEPPPG